MKLSPFLALVLLGGCIDSANDGDPAGGGKGDNGSATFGDVTTAWELTVGYAGDAVVAGVSVQPDHKLLVRSAFPRWLHRVTPDGKYDRTFGSFYPGSTERSGSLSVTAHDIWQISNDQFIASVGDGALFQLQSFAMADGTPTPSFGTAGTVPLVNTGLDADETLAVAYDRAGHRVLAVVVREWQKQTFSSNSYMLYGPSKLEVIAYDDATGAATSLGTHQLPPWSTEASNPARVRALVPQPDGSVVVLMTATDYLSLNDVATDWVQLHLQSGHAPEKTVLAVTDYDPPLVAYTALPDGGYDLYVSGYLKTPTSTDTAQKLLRISVDGSLASSIAVVDSGVDLSHNCPAAVATPGYLVFGHSPDRSKPIDFTAYPKSGAPIHFKSDKPQRCLESLSLGPDNHIYAGTWDTTNTGWTAQLTSFE